MKNFKFICSIVAALFCTLNLQAQGWIGTGTNLYPINSALGLTPLNIGIGVNSPSTQFHTTGGVRFQGLVPSVGAANRLLQADATGLLSVIAQGVGANQFLTQTATGLGWATIAPPTNDWSLTGNAAIAGQFLGTTNAIDLRFNTTNLQRMVLTAGGNLGIGVATPLQPLHTNGAVRHNSLAGTGNGMVITNSLGDLARLSNGAAGQVLTQTAPGVVIWATPSGGGFDNLGNHTATMALNMNCFNVQKVGGLQFCPSNLANVYLGTDAAGNVIAKPVPVGTDNLGNHIATQNLNMSCKGIDKAQYISFCNAANLTDIPSGNSGIPELSTRNPLGIGMPMPLPILGGKNMLAVKGSAYVEGDPGSIGIYGTIGGSLPVPALFCTPQYTQQFKASQIAVRGTSVTNAEFHVGTSGEAYKGYTGIGVLGYAESNKTAIGIYGTSYSGLYGYGVYGHIGKNVTASYAIYGDASSSCTQEYNTAPNAWAGYFNGDVFIAGTYGPSDRRLKTNINTMTDALSKIKQLHLATYNYDTDKYKQMMLPTGLRFGVIADELEKVFPNMVKQTIHPAKYDQKGAVITEAVEFKAVNYTELIPVALEGIKEQQSIIEEQQATIEDLKSRLDRLEAALNKLTGVSNDGLTTKNDVVKLAQNAPNPFSNKTIIAYELPKNMGKGQIIITDLVGKQIRVIQLNDCGGEIEISAQDLPNGTFVYSLIANGKILKTNKMVVSKQ